MMRSKKRLRFNIQVLTSLITLSLTLNACHEDMSEDSYDNDSRNEVPLGGSDSPHEEAGVNTNDGGVINHNSQSGEDFDGEQGGQSNISGDEPTANESRLDDQTQTWQESETAQRQASVDVGGGNSLTLHTQRVITKVEGHRARTIVDQVFYSPYDRQLEGTFRYSLPVGASVSHYALYIGRINGEFDSLGNRLTDEEPLAQADTRELFELSTDELVSRIGEDEEAWGELRVGRIVSQADGREAYEETTRNNIDPALVENVTPNAFQARVFPIQPMGFTRIIFAYDEALEQVDGELVYTFPLPDSELAHLSFQLLVEGNNESETELVSSLPLSPLPAREMGADRSQDDSDDASQDDSGDEQDDSGDEQDDSGDEQELAWAGEIEGQGPGGAVTLRLPAGESLEVITGQDGDVQAFTGRLKLTGVSELSTVAQDSRARALFVLDTSLSSQPTRFGINRQLLASILTQNPEIEEFAVLSFDLGAEWITEGFVSNTEASRSLMLAEVDQLLLEGATRFESVANAIASASWLGDDIDLFLLSDGAINWGTQSPDQVALQLGRVDQVFAYRTGIGAENLSLYRRLTGRGGVFSCLTMESISTCATAHRSPSLRLQELRIDGVGAQPAVVQDLVYTHSGGDVFDGAEIRFAGQLPVNGQAELRITLSDGTQEHVLTYPLALTHQTAHTLAPRAWAELLVSLMSESGQPQLKELILALAQRYTILTKEVVLLVLETDEEYETYNLSNAWDETLAGVESIVAHLEQAMSAGTLFLPLIEQTLASINPQITEATDLSLEEILAELDLNLYDLSLPTVVYEHQAVRGHGYHDGQTEPSDYGIYMDEAERRFADGLTSAAARALSSIVENDSANGVALRLVAYRLYTWGFSGLSAELFTEVLRRRPYEPQSYRDLAYVSRDERPALSALLYDIASRGQWDERFQQMNILISEEYSLFIRQLVRQDHPLATRLQARAQQLALPNNEEDLRVILSWNTDNVDIDLWVTDPSGVKCYYAQPDNGSGGQLLDDIIQGFGPERFSQPNAQSGDYFIQAHYYGNNGNRLEAETFIHVTVIKYAGSDRETIEEFDVLLAEANAVADVAYIRF
jgi:hypothetical protein